MSKWTEDMVAWSVKHWLEGKSATEIAQGLQTSYGANFTRNAVIGKLHRAGAMNKDRPRSAQYGNGEGTRLRLAAERAKRQAKAPRAPRPPKAAKPPRAPSIPVDVTNARPWLERLKGQCAYPLGERGSVHSCCAPTEETYCAGHREIMGGTRKAWAPRDMKHWERVAA